MSYCRWSSVNWRCDLYCYGDVSGGFTTHVAGNRIVGAIPQEPMWKLLTTDPDRFAREHKAVMEFLQTCDRQPIGLPHDGETFNDPDLPAFYARLVALRDLGYHCPHYLLEDVAEEIAMAEEAKS